MSRLRMGVVGVGHLGKEHARILSALPQVELIGVADLHLEQAEAIAHRLGTRAFRDPTMLLDLVDAVCVVVPTTHHHAVAAEFLRRGLGVLIEKPIALDIAQANSLVEQARQNKAVLQVGHIERFNPAFERLAERNPQPLFLSSQRHGRFTGRSTDIGVVLDLMIHDLDLILALVRSPVVEVRASGTSVFGRHEDVAHAWLRFASGCTASVSASRASYTAARCMELWSHQGSARIDFGERKLTLLQPSDEVRLYGLDTRKLDAAGLAQLKDELFGKHLQVTEIDCKQGDQLTRELEHFVDCVQNRRVPRVSGADGRDALALASRIVDALRLHRLEERELAAA
jgi:predicted dehydrogenase